MQDQNRIILSNLQSHEHACYGLSFENAWNSIKKSSTSLEYLKEFLTCLKEPHSAVNKHTRIIKFIVVLKEAGKVLNNFTRIISAVMRFQRATESEFILEEFQLSFRKRKLCERVLNESKRSNLHRFKKA